VILCARVNSAMRAPCKSWCKISQIAQRNQNLSKLLSCRWQSLGLHTLAPMCGQIEPSVVCAIPLIQGVFSSMHKFVRTFKIWPKKVKVVQICHWTSQPFGANSWSNLSIFSECDSSNSGFPLPRNNSFQITNFGSKNLRFDRFAFEQVQCTIKTF